MTDKQTEALKLALEALKEVNYDQAYATEIAAIREALAEQPAQQQEPVAWRVRWPKMGGGYKWIMNDAPLMAEHGFINEPLYTSPHPAQPSKPWAGLTEEQVFELIEANTEWKPAAGLWRLNEVEFARAIEAKLREKNA